MAEEGMQILVYAPTDLTTPIDIISRRWDPTALEEHNRDGGGSFKIRIDDEALDDDDDLLDEGNIVQVRVDGVNRVAFEIKKKKIQIVPEGEYAGEWLEISGTGLLEWFMHANVLPERGLSQIIDERAFNFTSIQGSWFKPAAWSNAVSRGLIKQVPIYPADSPEEWPKGLTGVHWIWSTTSDNAPVGDVFFRREFTTTAADNYRIVATADNYAAIYVDGVRVMVMNEYGSHNKTFAQDLELEGGNHIIAVQARNVSGPGGLAMALCKVSDNKSTEDIKDSERVIWTGDFLSSWRTLPYPAQRPGWTLGEILIKLFDEAKARGVTSMQRLTPTFTATNDSNGAAWPSTHDLVCGVGETYREVLQKIMDSYADVWVTPDFKIHAAPQRGVDRSVAIGSKDPVMFRRGLNVLSADTEVTAEIANAAFIKTSGGMVEVLGPSTSRSKYGRREAYLSAADSAGSALTDALSKQLFDKFAQPRYTPTLSILAGEEYTPWVDFQVGDWVLAPSDEDPIKLIKRRIMSISAQENATGQITYVCEIDSIQESYEERVNRWLQSIANDNMSGGVSGTSGGGGKSGDLPMPGSEEGNPPIPRVSDRRIPTAPTGVTVTASIVETVGERPGGTLQVTWNHDGKALDGTALAPARYQAWIKEDISTIYYVLGEASGTNTQLFATGLRVKTVTGAAVKYDVVVRAMADSGKMSDFSQPVRVTMVDDTTAPLKPATPVVTVSRAVFRIVTTTKDLNGAAVAPDYEYTIVESSATSTGTYVEHDRLYGPGETLVGGFGYATRWFRIRHVDRSGNISVPSTAVSATTVPLVDADIILSKIDAANTQIVNVGEESLKTGAILTRHLADNQITQTKLQDRIISVTKLATTVEADIAKGISDAAAAQGTANTANTAAGTAQTAANKAQAKVDALAAQGANLAINGDLELPLNAGSTAATEWSTRQLAYCEVDSRSRSGTQLLRFAPTTSSSFHYSNYISATAGRTFYFEYWARLGAALVDTNPSTAGVNFTVSLTYLDNTTATIIVFPDSSYSLTNLTTTGWTRITGSYTVSSSSNAKSIRVAPRGVGNGNSYLIDDFRIVDMTEAKAALDAAATAQQKADDAFDDAAEALEAAGLAQSSASGKNSNYYTSSAPAGTGFTVGDVWFRASDNLPHKWSGSAWVSIRDQGITAAQEAADTAGQTALDMVNISTSDAPTGAVAPGSGAIWQKIDANNTDRVIQQWVAGGDLVYKIRYLQDEAFGSISAVKITTGTLSTQRLDAVDLKARVLEAGKISALDMVTGTITAASGIIGSLDIGKVTTGTMSGSFITARTLRTQAFVVADLTTFAPPLTRVTGPGIDQDDWDMTGQMEVVTSGLDDSGYRFQVTNATNDSRAYGPIMPVKPGEKLYGAATLYRGSATIAAYLRYEFLNSAKVGLSGGSGFNYIGAPQATSSANGTRFAVTATVPVGAAYARWYVIVSAGTGSTGFYNFEGRRMTGTTYIEDGAITTDKVKANAVMARHIFIGDFTNRMVGSDFESLADIPWAITGPSHYRTNGTARAGTYSLHLNGATQGITTVIASNFTGDASVMPGEKWLFRLYGHKSSTANPGGNSKLRIESAQSGNVLGSIMFDQFTTSWSTTPYELEITIPTGTTTLNIAIWSDHSAGSIYLDDIQMRRVAEQSLIQNLGVEKLVANTASIDTAVVTKLWTEVVRSKKITTDMMVVGRGTNLIYDEYFEDAAVKTHRHNTANGQWGAWGRNTTTNLNWYGASSLDGVTARTFYFVGNGPGTYQKDSFIPVEEGQKFRLSVKYTSDVSGPRGTILYIDKDGSTGYTSGGWNSTSYAGAGSGAFLERIYTVPSTVAYIMPAVQFNSTCTSAYVYGGATFTNMTTASLLVDGAIVARHLTVTDELTTKVLGAYKIKAVNIDTNDLQADTSFVSDMRGNILTVDVVNSTTVKADAITSKHTITGALMQTSATANRGIKFSSSALRVYDGIGTETFSITASTGVVVGTGKFRTGTDGNFIEMVGEADGGRIRFWTGGEGTGKGRGSIWARNDPTDGEKMSMAYSTLDAPDGNTLPVLVVTPTKAYMRYGSKAVQVWKNTSGSEELLIDGSTVLRGNLDLRDGGTRVEFRHGTSASSLAFIGNRPESGTGADFEIRPVTGGVRITGALTNFQAYNLTTTGTANLNVDSSGNIKRSSSSARYKDDIKPLEIKKSVLNVKMKDWVDKGEKERAEKFKDLERPLTETMQQQVDSVNLRRIPGLIAEELVEQGLDQFVHFGPQGQTEGVMYERFAFAQIQALIEEVEALKKEVTTLKGKITTTK